jgi:hypothetical protein
MPDKPARPDKENVEAVGREEKVFFSLYSPKSKRRA